jgi:peptide/nickel transport system substrate-binding protein
LASAPINLDPRFATDAASERINRLIYRSLVVLDDASRPQPSLASWTLIAPGRYRFHLAESGRSFHDGTRMNARDVIATYRSILDPSTASPHRKTLSMIKEILELDDNTIDFVLSKYDILFPAYLTIGILPEKAIEENHSLAKNPIGSGLFRFENWPQPGTLILTRVADLQQLVFEKVADPTMRVLKLMRGEIDLLQNDLPTELVTLLTKRSGISVQHTAGSNFTYLGFNLENEKTTSLAIRQAISLAIDRNEIIQHIFSNGARKATALLPASHWAGGKGLPQINQDLVAARKLLAEAGYNSQNPLRLEYKTSSDPFRIRIATILQQQLADAGIRVDIKSYDWGTFYGDIKAGRFQLFSLTWGGVKTPDIFRYVFHSDSLPPEGANRGRLKDTVTDQLIAAAENETNMDRKALLFQQIQAHLLKILPYIPLWYEDQFAATRDNIQNYQVAADGNFDALVSTVKSF